MVDWDLAVDCDCGCPDRRRRARDRPRTRPRRWWPSCARRRPLDRAGPRLHRAGAPREPPRRCWSSTGRAGCRPTPTASRRSSTRWSTSSSREEGRADRAVAGGRVAGHRRRGRRAARVPGRQGARPVRPVLRARPAGCCWSRPTSSTSSASSTSTRTTSGSGCACTRRPTGCSSPPCRGCATTCRRDRRARRHHRARRARSTTALRRIAEALSGGERRSLIDLIGTPEQKEIVDRVTGMMSLLEGHADVVMDGVGPR